MSRLPIRFILTISIATLSLALLTWSLSPPGRSTSRQSVQPARSGLQEVRLLDLDVPVTIRAGEVDWVYLTLEPGASLAPPAQFAGQAASDPDVYTTDDVLAEARLDLEGMEISPLGTVSEPLFPGQRVTFFWSVRPSEVGRFKGTAWLYLRFVPKNGGPEHRQAISAQAIEIESSTLFGLQAEPARWLGLAGVFISSLLGFSFFIDALKWLRKR